MRFPSLRLMRGVLAALLTSVGVLVACTAPVAPQLTRSPYLTDLVGQSVEVNWATDTSDTVGSVSWGAVDAAGGCTPTNVVAGAYTSITVGTTAEYQWKALLALPGAGRYCYRVMLGPVDLLAGNPSPVFATQVPAGSTAPFSFAVLGDWGQTDAAGDNADTSRLLGQVAHSGRASSCRSGTTATPRAAKPTTVI